MTEPAPVKCSDCAHWTNGPPLDCAMVPRDIRYRSIVLVDKYWTAENSGCDDFAPKPRLVARIGRWIADMAGSVGGR